MQARTLAQVSGESNVEQEHKPEPVQPAVNDAAAFNAGENMQLTEKMIATGPANASSSPSRPTVAAAEEVPRGAEARDTINMAHASPIPNLEDNPSAPVTTQNQDLI